LGERAERGSLEGIIAAVAAGLDCCRLTLVVDEPIVVLVLFDSARS
jgi:hypothetical protein